MLGILDFILDIFYWLGDAAVEGVNWVFTPIFPILTPIGINETNFQFMLVGAILGISIYVTLYGGMFSLANAGFMAIGAYVSVILTQTYTWAFLPALMTGMLTAGFLAIFIGLPVLRLNDIYLAIATIGFGEIIVVLVRNFDKIYTEITGEKEIITGGATGIKGIPVTTETGHLIIFILVLSYFLYRMHRSRFGRALVAIRQDPNVAANMGINVVYYKNMAFILGAMVAGLAGGLSGHLTRIITPEGYGFNKAVEILSYAVLGGTGSLGGPIIGGMSLEYLPELLRRVEFIESLSNLLGTDLTKQESPIRGMINGAILILVIEFLPGGLVEIRWRGIVQFLRRSSRLWHWKR